MAKTVTVSGTGSTAPEAENDALRNAIENAVGVLIDSQTLVEKNVVLHDQIYSHSKGFIRNYTVLDKSQQGGMWTVKVEADVDDSPNSKLMTELTRLGIIDTKLRNPKIAVYIPETHIAYRVPDPAGETAVIKAFVDAGFTNMIAASPKLQVINPNRFAWYSKPVVQVNIEDLRNAARFFEADIIIMGEAFSEGVGDVGRNLPGRQVTNALSCKARAEAKMYVAKTGQIIAADGKFAAGVDSSEAVASKKALAAAGKLLGEYFVEKLMESGSGNRQGFELIVKGSDFSKVNQVQNALGRVNGIKNVNLSSYDNGTATFSLIYSGAPTTLFKEIQAATDANLNLVSSAYNSMVISVN
jgi:hypothetical protein